MSFGQVIAEGRKRLGISALIDSDMALVMSEEAALMTPFQWLRIMRATTRMGSIAQRNAPWGHCRHSRSAMPRRM